MIKVRRKGCTISWESTHKQGNENHANALTQSVRAQKESNVKATRVRMAQNLLKAGFSVDIIYQATGLSTDKYDNKEKKVSNGSKRQNEGEEIKKWRIIRARIFSRKARCITFENTQL